MKEKIKKIICLLIVTLSILLLFVPWVKLDRDDLFDYFGIGNGASTLSAYKAGVDSYYKKTRERFEENADIKISSGKIKKVAEVFYDFELSPSEMDTYSSIMADPIKKYARFLDEEYLSLSSDADNVSAVEEIYDKHILISRVCTVFHIIYLLTWVAFALYAVNALTGKLGLFKYLFFVMRAVMVAAVVFVVYYNNNELLLNVSSSLTLWPFLALIFALPDSIYSRLIDKVLNSPKLEAAFANAGNAVKQGLDKFPTEQIKKTVSETVKSTTSSIGLDSGWTCPDCGTKNSNDSKFCSGCGKPNPFVVTCPKCGTELKNHEKFCPNCGETITWVETDIVCPNCGTHNPLDSAFCENCGTKLN